MLISAPILKRLADLNLPAEAFKEILAILAEVQGADDARRERQRNRKARSRDKSRDKSVTVTGLSRDGPPSYSLKKESKIPVSEPNGSDPGATQAELERELFRRGRQVCGKSSGGLINTLLKAKQYDVSLARSVLELAATKDDPRAFIAAATRAPNGHNNPNSLLAAFDRLDERLEQALASADGEQGSEADLFRLPPR